MMISINPYQLVIYVSTAGLVIHYNHSLSITIATDKLFVNEMISCCTCSTSLHTECNGDKPDPHLSQHTYIHTYIHTRIRAYIDTYIHRYLHTWMHEEIVHEHQHCYFTCINPTERVSCIAYSPQDDNYGIDVGR